MARTLKLTRFSLAHVNYFWLGAYRLRVEASDPDNTGTDPNVFLYNRGLPNPSDDNRVYDYWLGVASPVDMADYPVGEPDNRTTYPIFRLSYFEVDLRAVTLADDVWARTQSQVDNLLMALDRMEQLVNTAEVWVGSPQEDDEEPTSSASLSASESLSTST